MSRFLISCGGTGGHLSPGISLAQGLAARGHKASLLVSLKKVDSRLLEKYPDLDFQRMPGSGFSWHPARMAVLRLVAASRGSLLPLDRPLDAPRLHRGIRRDSRRPRPPSRAA